MSAIRAALRHPLWSDASDLEIADHLGCRPADVARERAALRRDLLLAEAVQRLERLAARIGWTGSAGELLIELVAAEEERQHGRVYQHTDERSQALRDALRAMEEEARHAA